MNVGSSFFRDSALVPKHKSTPCSLLVVRPTCSPLESPSYLGASVFPTILKLKKGKKIFLTTGPRGPKDPVFCYYFSLACLLMDRAEWMIRLRPGYLISAPSIGKLPVVDGRVNYIRSGRPMDYPKLCTYRFTLIAFPVSNGRRHVV